MRIEDQRPAVGGQAEFPHLAEVEAEQRDRGGIGHRVAVARIEPGVEELALDVAEVRQLRLVDRAQGLAPDQRFDGIAGRHQDVVADGAGLQLGQHFLVVGVVVLLQPAAAMRLKALHRVVGDVVVPVVEVEGVGGARHGRQRQQRGRQTDCRERFGMPP